MTPELSPPLLVEVAPPRPEEGSVDGVGVVEVMSPVVPDDGVAGGGGADISGLDAGTLQELELLYWRGVGKTG